ncbi:hypothetical protein BGX27_007231 [Mortierella sp. AM989]|nr:hypothetical protein BGX27_007231 [Mortierella sp. AM989]
MSSSPPTEDIPSPSFNQEIALPSASATDTTRLSTDTVVNNNLPNVQEHPSRIAIPQRQFTLLHNIRTNSNDFGNRYRSQITQSPTSARLTPTTPTSANAFRSEINPFDEPLSTRPKASHTFAEGMSSSIQSLRRKAFERINTMNTAADSSGTIKAESTSAIVANETGSSTGIARPIMPRSRPSLTQFKLRDQPSKMFIPPQYGQEIVLEAATALAAGIPHGVPRSNTIHSHGRDPTPRALSESESVTSDDEPEVRVHVEIHLQEDADSEPICPLSEKNLSTLAQELDLTSQERGEVEAIQTKEELAAYFENIPRDYDVQIISDLPESPEVTFAQDDFIHYGDTIAVVRRESFHEKKGPRRKQKYRRPTTDLSTMPIQEPKASWLELFYDLLFVANLNNFTHSHSITGGAALGRYIAWFVIMWWAWAGQTFWAARYDTDDLFTKLWKLVEFFALISFGAFSSDHLNHTATEFIISYIVLKAVLVIEYGNEHYWIAQFELRCSVLARCAWSVLASIRAGHYNFTTALSQLWAYLHLPLHVCIVLVGTGALDLIRLYKEEHHILDGLVPGMEHLTSSEYRLLPLLSSNQISRFVATGFEVPVERRSASAAAGGESLLTRDTDYDLTKRYFLVACSLVFLCNSLIKWINLRSYDRFQKIVYLSRLLNAVLILCLLAVPLDKMTPVALLGSMALFCVVQVAVDLAVIYFGAYGFVEDLEAWARSARSSIDLGSFLPSPLGSRSRPSSIINSKAGSVVNLNTLLKASSGTKAQYYANNNSTTSLVNPKRSSISHPGGPYTVQQSQLSPQPQTSHLSQQQQQALYNMHVNANSLGSSGAYGNLVQALAEIKKREQWNHTGDGLLPSRQISLSAAERGPPTNISSLDIAIAQRRAGAGVANTSPLLGNTRHRTSISQYSGTSSPMPIETIGSSDGQNPPHASGIPGIGAIGLASLFNQPPSTLPK